MLDIVFKYWKQRVRECKRCPHSKVFAGKLTTCGTFAVGDVVTVDGKQYELCGCVMQIKAKIERATCPLNNWQDAYNTDKQ